MKIKICEKICNEKITLRLNKECTICLDER